MTKWEKWIKEYAKRNYTDVLIVVLNSIRSKPRFNKATERIFNALKKDKRFYLKNDEKLDLIMEFKGKPMGLNRALALSWCCNCSLSCFNWQVNGEELILTYNGYYSRTGRLYFFMGSNCKREDITLLYPTLWDYLLDSKRYREDELWKLR